MENKKSQFRPAFPTSVGYEDGTPQTSYQTGNTEAHHSGMSKRFYAACAAMQGLLSNEALHKIDVELTSEQAKEKIIEVAYDLADELLKQENE